jgi:hypothetical protein
MLMPRDEESATLCHANGNECNRPGNGEADVEGGRRPIERLTDDGS